MAKPKRINITPTPTPMPYVMDDDPEGSPLEELQTTALTAELLEALGAQIDVDPRTLDQEKKLLDDAITQQNVTPLRSSLPAALASAQFLKDYGTRLAIDAVQVRTALTHKLLEIADCGDTKHELRAIELLGKHSDIGLFTERSEININYNSPEALERAIKERVKRLLNADVIDEKPLGMDLEEELGIHEGEFEEVEDAEDGEDIESDEAPDEEDDADDAASGWFDVDE